MTNLEKLIEVFGCKVIENYLVTKTSVNLDKKIQFSNSWCNCEYKEPSHNEKLSNTVR